MDDLDSLRTVVEEADREYGSDRPVEALTLLGGLEFPADARSGALYTQFLLVKGSAQAETGLNEQAKASFEEALECQRVRNDKAGMGLTYFNLGNVCKYSGQPLDAERNYRMAIECYEGPGSQMLPAMAWLSLGHIAGSAGNWSESQRCLYAVIAILKNVNPLSPDVMWSERSLEVKLAIVHGDDEQAIELGMEAVEAGRQSGVPVYEAESLVFLAEALARQGATEKARACITRLNAALAKSSGTLANNLRRQARAALMKINNLDFAFGAPAVNAPIEAKPSSALSVASVASSDPSPSEISQDAVKGTTPAEILTDVCVFSVQDASVTVVAAGKMIVLDVLDANTWSHLDEDWAAQESGKQGLTQIVAGMIRKGIECNAAGRADLAVAYYFFALRVAIRLEVIDGVEAMTGNVFSLIKRETAMVKYPMSPLASGADDSPVLTGGNLIIMPGNGDSQADSMLGFVRSEAISALAAFQKVEQWRNSEGTSATRLLVLRSLRRLQSLAGRRGVPSDLVEICRLSEQVGDIDSALISIYEDLAEATFSDILRYLGKIDADAADGQIVAGFDSTWELYLTWRPRVSSNSSPLVPIAASQALEHFEVLRSQAVAGGGAFGHRISYDTTQFPARISRDLIHMKIGDESQQLDGLTLAERSCSRALVDWMARTHPNNRLMIRRGISRSVGEVRTASLDEIFAAATETDATILYYVTVADGFGLWAIHPDRTWKFDLLSDTASLLLKLFSALPYTFEAPDFAHVRTKATAAAHQMEDAEIDQLLVDVGSRLLPEWLRKDLDAVAPERIVIIADQMLQFVPFSCLRLDAKSYFGERFPLIYWPSVTAWLLSIQAEAAIATGQLSASVIIGGPDFSKGLSLQYRGLPQRIQLEELPHALEEAKEIGKLLGVDPLLGQDATFDGLMKSMGERVPLLHVATHGFTDVWDPDQSFLALSDRLLTAEFLYSWDAGLKARMVMLSCCQTAIGYVHPDSILGLANGFLVAGACTVGSTLWNVDDEATSSLMSYFYAELKADKDVATALAAAQKHLREIPAWSHPIYWAPFRVTGSMTNPLTGSTKTKES